MWILCWRPKWNIRANKSQKTIYHGEPPGSSFLVRKPKKGDVACIENYRGIAIASVIPKLFDAVLTVKLTANIEKHLHDSQHGFRHHRHEVSEKGRRSIYWLCEGLRSHFAVYNSAKTSRNQNTSSDNNSSHEVHIVQKIYITNQRLVDEGRSRISDICPTGFTHRASGFHPCHLWYDQRNTTYLQITRLRVKYNSISEWSSDNKLVINATKTCIMKFTNRR